MQIYKENIMKKKEIKKLTKVQMKENIEKLVRTIFSLNKNTSSNRGVMIYLPVLSIYPHLPSTLTPAIPSLNKNMSSNWSI